MVENKKSFNFTVPLLIILLVGAVFSLGVMWSKLQNTPKGSNNPTQALATPSPQQGKPAQAVLGEAQIAKLTEGGQALGSPEAPVTIVEFSDFQCPYCGQFFKNTLPQIEDEYVKTGKVRYLFRHFPLSSHQYAQKAAEATECAGEQGKFWEMHDKIFENQEKITVADLKKYAADLELDSSFNSCLDSGKFQAKVQADLKLGQDIGVTGTPAFFINGRSLSGAQPFINFKAVIDEELAK